MLIIDTLLDVLDVFKSWACFRAEYSLTKMITTDIHGWSTSTSPQLLPLNFKNVVRNYYVITQNVNRFSYRQHQIKSNTKTETICRHCLKSSSSEYQFQTWKVF